MAQGRNAEAIAIYQGLMEQVDICFNAVDVARHAELIHVPHHIRNRRDSFHIRSRDELRAAFLRYTAYASEIGSVRSQRICQTAKFRNKDSIEGTHTLEFFDENDALVTSVTLTTSVLMRMLGRWVVCSSEHTTNEITGIEKAVRNVQKTMPPQPLTFYTPKLERETND